MYELRLIRERRAGYPTPRASLPNSEAVVRAFRAHFAALDREQVLVVLLDTKNKILGFHVVSTGTLNSSLVHPRELFKVAIVASAASVIVLHNHPSGDPQPSAEDYAITQRLVAAGKLLGISLVDSIVVGEDDSYFSFADAGRLEDAQEIRDRAAETVCESALRVGCYARVSTSDQTADNQILDLRRYAAQRGWTIIEEFVDHGVSGAKDSRPSLNRLMLAARQRRFDIVLVWRFDRFARSTSHLIRALDEFRTLGVGFSSFGEALDTGTPTGKVMFTVIAAMAEFERSLIQERVRAGLRRARAEGQRLGRPPVGADVWKAHRLVREGLSLRQAAKRIGVSDRTLRRRLAMAVSGAGVAPGSDPPSTTSSVA